MVNEKRLDNLQDEIKLLKAEVKNSLASVRDYLLNMELPSSEFSTILAALAGDDANPQKMNVDSHVANDKDGMPKPEYIQEGPEIPGEGFNPEPTQPGEFEDLLDFEESGKEDEAAEEMPDERPLDNNLLEEEDNLPDEDSLLSEDESDETEDDDSVQEESDEEPTEELDLPLEEVRPMEYERTNNEVNQGIPKVNMLANLINWVARAKKEIGYDELPTFLEVYGVSGHLSPELKDVIIHLAEVTKDHPDVATDAEIWSQSMLSLHGILTGGDAPLNPVIPSWVDSNDEAESADEEEIIEIDKEKRAKLKLVFPSGNGKSKEFCIDLTPEENGGGSK